MTLSTGRSCISAHYIESPANQRGNGLSVALSLRRGHSNLLKSLLVCTAVKHCVRLRSEAQYRLKSQRVLVSGEDILQELSKRAVDTNHQQILQIYAVEDVTLEKWGMLNLAEQELQAVSAQRLCLQHVC